MNVTAIIPAYNEEKNIIHVIRSLQESCLIDEIIVVDDGSSDGTVAVAKSMGVHVVLHDRNRGKGVAMVTGAKVAHTDTLFFADADLLHFTPQHIDALIAPVKSGQIGMTVGLRDRGAFLMWLLPYIAPVLGGERVLRRDMFLKLGGRGISDFGIETIMNAYCKKHHIPVRYIPLPGVKQVIKERKYGYWNGFIARIKMIVQILRAEIEVLVNKNL